MVLGFISGFLYLLTDVVYWAKYYASYIALKLWKANHGRRFDLYDYEALNNAEKTGILVPKEEEILESPYPEEHLQNAADEVFIYGVNSKSQCVLIRLARSSNNESDAWIYLKLGNDQWYQLEKKSGHQRTFGNKCTTFSCGSLQMHFLSPMRRWRISYCGMMKEARNGSSNKKNVFVKFTFVWTACSDVYDASTDLDIKLTADAMAQAKWTSIIPPVEKITEALNYYCQAGVITGLVSFENEEDEEMYLVGEKIRNIGKGAYLVGSKFEHIMGVVPENGLVLHLSRISSPHVCENLYYGFVEHPNGDTKIIEDGFIVTKRSTSQETKKNFTVMLKAERNYELNGDVFGNELQFSSESGWIGQVQMNELEFEIDGLAGKGLMLSGEVSDFPKLKLQQKNIGLPSVIPFVVNLTDEVSHSTEICGGKGSSLGHLTKLSSVMKSFIVPKGIVVTTAAYSEFLTAEILEKIENLKSIVYGNSKGDKQEACKLVISAMEHANLPDKIAKEIEAKLNGLFSGEIDHRKFAVRSSATGEDTDQMSAAGQMETFLGVQGLKVVLSAVKKCWGSQFSHIAVEYKRQNGQILNSPMAVVIQEMIECEAAGVLFTCDPVTNNPSVVVVTGNYGLGESVVSGSEEPDTIVLEKTESDVEVKSITVGQKQHQIVMRVSDTAENSSGTIREDVEENERNQCCISEEVAKSLGRLSLKVEEYFRSPRDIEWGIQKNTIYILQSRPVTTGATISDYEIKHEFDAPVRCEKDAFTTCNVGEVMPGAMSPLGIEIITKYMTAVFRLEQVAKLQNANFQKNKYYPSSLVPFYNHLMMVISDTITQEGDTNSMMTKSMMIGVYGRILDDPDITAIAKHRISSSTQKKGLFAILRLIQRLFFCGNGIERINKEVFNYHPITLNCETAKEAFETQMNSCSIASVPFAVHLDCSGMSAFWNILMLTVLANAKGKLDNDVYSDFAKLLASQSNVESANIPTSLKELTQAIVKEMKSEDFRAMSVEETKQWLETSPSNAGCKFRQFIKRHGHRSIREFDMRSVPWHRDSTPLVQLLQNMCISCESSGETEDKSKSVSKLMSELKVPLNTKSKLLLRFLLPNCRRGVREREACKSNVVKAMDNVRKGYEHLSKKMVAEGFLPDAELLYFLTIDEMKYLLETRNPRLIARANHRRKLNPFLAELQFLEISKGRPVPINENNSDAEEEYISDYTMQGIPVSQGSVKGYARVAVTLEEAAHLQKGEILITYSTDICWSPYFPILAGVVTELGGLISHGAVVSREYGLPCVVGLHGAVKKFSTGDYVLLDGNKGILKKLSPLPK